MEIYRTNISTKQRERQAQMTIARTDTKLKIAVVFIGSHASGKTLFFERYFSDAYTHIELSALRTRQREKSALRQCYKHSDSFVADNPNLTPDDRARYIPEAKEKGYRVIGYYFSMDERIAEEMESASPDKEMLRVYEKDMKKLRMPTIDEGFDELYKVTLTRGGDFKTEKL